MPDRSQRRLPALAAAPAAHDWLSPFFGYSYAERLSALDASFLDLESESVHMHVASVAVFEGGPLVDAHGALDFERIRSEAEGVLRASARFRQRLARDPVFGHPVWVDDPQFNLDYHFRHTALPAPGDERQLKRLAGRILSEKLERSRPLWEMWFVEGLEGGRFAVIAKIHHALVDGVSGVDLIGAFMSVDPDSRWRQPTGRWVPRPAPSRGQLAAEELLTRATAPVAGLRQLARAAGDPLGSAAGLWQGLRDVGEALAGGIDLGEPTPLNQPVGPHRRCDWCDMELAALREIRERHGGTLNDVAVSLAAGALRRYLLHRGVDADQLRLRALLPVSVRRRSERGRLGNRVAFLLARLPLELDDPVERLRAASEETRNLKASGQIQGAEWIQGLVDRVDPRWVSAMSRIGASRLAFHTVITNVPGPPRPLYLMGARLERMHPMVPLFSHQALGFALFTYDGMLSWGLTACRDAVDDLHSIVEALQLELERLRKAGGRAARGEGEG